MESAEFTPERVRALAAADVQRALEEDVGAGDLTAALVDPQRRTVARILAREPAVVCGAPWVEAAVRTLDPTARLVWHVAEGQRCTADQVVLEIHGRAQALLTAERTALNFLQMMSAVATRTAQYVAAVEAAVGPALVAAGKAPRIVDTRKTLPGLRLAQKYAVLQGGGQNHRLGLYDAVLIKENHIAAAGGVKAVLQRVKDTAPKARFVQIEVETLAQLEEALQAGARMVLLDNMDLDTLAAAVRLNAGRAILEISGGVNLDTVGELARTGVDRISIGALTKDVKAIDYSMRFAD
ncbi:MAG: carboxylating nicotinate-nucleotide diphosphorylase [Serpentinimonas sp.]|nr:carboxylating nicotinate-nucleotide diphosphorylase [Serpentinimonas sp.]